MSGFSPLSGSSVALVIQTRITEAGRAAYFQFLSRVADRLRDWPGFTSQEVVPPAPPTQVDWVVIEHFTSAEAARDWIQSADRAALRAEIRQHVVGQEDLHLLTDTSRGQPRTASVVFGHSVAPDDEPAFLKWQQGIQAAEARFKGFVRHKIERPIPGVQDHWTTIVTFDSDANLDKWQNSSERAAMIANGERFNRNLTVRRSSYGFDFWFPANEAVSGGKHLILKQNLLVLLTLYPIVFLWGYFIGGPLLDTRGVPFWLSLFIGNLVSTQLLGWWIAPWALGKFGWWLQPKTSTWRHIAGYALVLVLYCVSMAAYAALLTWNWGKES